MTEPTEQRHAPLSRSPLDRWHATRRAQFAERDGWRVPLVYTNAAAEVAAARSGAAAADISAFAKLSLHGHWASALTRAASRPGAVARPLNALDTLACRLSDDHLLLLATAPGASGFAECLEHLPPGAPLLRQDATSAYAGLWLFGPQMGDILARLTPLDVGPTALPPGSCTETGLAGVHALLIHPPGLSLPSLIVLLAPDAAEYVWERVFACGVVVTPLGLDGLGELARPKG